MKKIFFLLIAAAVAIGCLFFFRNKPQVRKVKQTTQSTLEKTQQAVTSAVKEGMQRANKLKTNASADVKAGMHEASKVATNTVTQVKEVTTDVVHQVQKAMGGTN